MPTTSFSQRGALLSIAVAQKQVKILSFTSENFQSNGIKSNSKSLLVDLVFWYITALLPSMVVQAFGFIRNVLTSAKIWCENILVKSKACTTIWCNKPIKSHYTRSTRKGFRSFYYTLKLDIYQFYTDVLPQLALIQILEGRRPCPRDKVPCVLYRRVQLAMAPPHLHHVALLLLPLLGHGRGLQVLLLPFIKGGINTPLLPLLLLEGFIS